MASFRAVALILAIVGAVALQGRARAAYDSLDGCRPSWQRQFGVDILILDCRPGYYSEHDRLFMYAREPVDTAADWRTQINTENAVWVFDAGATGRASLLIDFRRDQGALVADFYDDANGDGELRHGLERGYPRSIESRFPSLTVIAPDGWWSRQGTVNYNLTLRTDGPVNAAFNSEVFLEFTRTDGIADIVTRVFDRDGDGRPDWQIIQTRPPISDLSAIYRTLLMVNTADDEVPVETYILWPHLGQFGAGNLIVEPPARRPLGAISEAAYGIVKNYHESFPPIQIDFSRRRIQVIGEFVASRGRPTNWFIYSLLRFGDGGAVDANFENPFAFYNLAGKDDGVPDLIIRDQSWVAADYFSDTPIEEPFHQTRYSWDHDHTQRLSYMISTAGRRPMPSVVEVGEGVAVRTVPYAEFPKWVIENDWEAVNFIATETPRFWTTEGIYSGCTACSEEQQNYLAGFSLEKRNLLGGSIAVGFRGEAVGFLGGRPRLYLDAVDHKLHLIGAELGYWQLTDQRQLRYAYSPDGRVKRWEDVEAGGLFGVLARVGGWLVLSTPAGVEVGRGPAERELATIAPPTDRASWEAFRDLHRLVASYDEGHDIATMFRARASEVETIPGAEAWSFADAGGEETFLLRLVERKGAGALLPAMDRGTYRLRVDPVTGATISPAPAVPISLGSPRTRGDDAVEQMPTRLSVSVVNPSAVPIPQAVISILAWRDAGGQDARVAATTTTRIDADGTTPIEMTWIPVLPGDWTLQAFATGGATAVSEVAAVRVNRVPPSDLATILTAQRLPPFASGAITASLTLGVAISIGVAFLVWADRTRTRED